MNTPFRLRLAALCLFPGLVYPTGQSWKTIPMKPVLLPELMPRQVVCPGRMVAAPMSRDDLLEEAAHRAFLFFQQKADPVTGLVNDRAKNQGSDTYDIASIAATGYGLAALPIAVEHHWMSRPDAEACAEKTLRFLVEQMPHKHGWMYHFVERRTGQRVWKCEISSMDTGLLVLGALVCGQYFHGSAVEGLANRLYDRLDWEWIRTNGGKKPAKRLIAHGWKPESGFLGYDYDEYSEAILLYLLGLGAKENPLPSASWDAWKRRRVTYPLPTGEAETLTGGAIFLHQMPFGYYDLRGMRDRPGFDYMVSAENAHRIHRQFCRDRAVQRRTYRAGYWGLNASDGPKGYRAYGFPEPEDGTVSPTGMIASVLFFPLETQRIAEKMADELKGELWGHYGFSNAFNLDKNWYDTEVIGIDLGMALLAIENHRSGLVWRLLAGHPATGRALKRAGFHRTKESGIRPLRMPPAQKQAASADLVSGCLEQKDAGSSTMLEEARDTARRCAIIVRLFSAVSALYKPSIMVVVKDLPVCIPAVVRLPSCNFGKGLLGTYG